MPAQPIPPKLNADGSPINAPKAKTVMPMADFINFQADWLCDNTELKGSEIKRFKEVFTRLTAKP